MIDVIEHIVNKSKLIFALDNIRQCLAADGLFMVAPVTTVSKKHLFYVHSWSIEDIRPQFDGCQIREPAPFRNDTILVVKKP
jgi:hypothetical protein